MIRFWELPSGRAVGRIENAGSKVCSLGFSADGGRLVSGLNNGTALVWDVKQLIHASPRQAKRPSAERLERLWNDLAGSDGWFIWQALSELHDAPGTVHFLSQRLAPATAPDPARLARLLAALDSDDFAQREEAERRLRELPEQAGPALRRGLKTTASAEVRRRLGDVLTNWPPFSPEVLRVRRAILLLEWTGSAEARTLLKALSQGCPDAPETRAARAALDRLAKRASPEIAAP